MPRLQRKSFDKPDGARALGAGLIELVELDEITVGRARLDPGWRWSKDVRPVVGTTSCQVRHVAYAISGVLHVVMDDGTELDIVAGDVHEIPPGHDAWVVGDESYVSVEWANSGRYGEAPDELGDRVLATILFTDIVDSTATLERLGDTRWRRILIEHNARMRGQLDRFRGREVATTGDGMLAVFESPVRAVTCAASMGPAVADLGIRIRTGLHTGEVELVAGNPRGLAVHAAARIAALAGPGDVLVSGTSKDLLDGAGLAFEDRGAHELKGLTTPRQVFALVPAARTELPG